MAFQVTEVQKALKGADYPMDGSRLSQLAKRSHVDGPNAVMQELKGDLGGSS